MSEAGSKTVLAGTLLKKHQKGFLGKNWDKRFFVLTHDQLIYRHSPLDDDPNEKVFEIRFLMSVNKIGNRTIELRFSERNLVIRCANDDEHDRWYRALDMVRFQPLPYEVGPKEVPVPQIVPPIVPRMPVSDQPEEEDEYDEDGPEGPHLNGSPGGRIPRDAARHMRSSSLLEREIAQRMAEAGVDPLVPPKFLKRLSQGSLEVMTKAGGSLTVPISGVAGLANKGSPGAMSAEAMRARLENPNSMSMSFRNRGDRGEAPVYSGNSRTSMDPGITIQRGGSMGRPGTAKQSPSDQGPRITLPLPDLDDPEPSPRSKLTSGAAPRLTGALQVHTSGQLGGAGRQHLPPPPVSEASPFSGLRPLAGRLSNDLDETPPRPLAPQRQGPDPSSERRTSGGRRGGDFLEFSDDDEPGPAGGERSRNGLASGAGDRRRQGNVAARAAPGHQDRSELELFLDDDWDTPQPKGPAPNARTGGAGPSAPRHAPAARAPSFGERNPAPGPARGQPTAQHRSEGESWLAEDFDSDEEGGGPAARRPQPASASFQPGQQPSRSASSAARPPPSHGGQPPPPNDPGRQAPPPTGAASGPMVPLPPPNPRPVHSFVRTAPAAPPASRPTSRPGSDFRRGRHSSAAMDRDASTGSSNTAGRVSNGSSAPAAPAGPPAPPPPPPPAAPAPPQLGADNRPNSGKENGSGPGPGFKPVPAAVHAYGGPGVSGTAPPPPPPPAPAGGRSAAGGRHVEESILEDWDD